MAVLVKRAWPLAVPVLLAAHVATLAALSPIANADWPVVLGDPTPASARGWLHAALVGVPGLHVVVTPLVALALIVAIAWLARGRAPDLRDAGDAATLALAGALVWGAAPRTGVVLSYRAAAPELYAACGAVWLAIAWLANPRRLVAAAGLAAVAAVAASCSRPIGTAALIVAAGELAVAPGRASRARVAIALGLAVGVAAVWLAPPAAELDLAWQRGFAHVVHDTLTALRAPIIVALLVVAAAVVQRVRGRDADPAALLAAVALAARAVPAAAIVGLVVELDPRPDSVAVFGAGVAVAVVAAHAVVAMAAGDRALRAIAIAAVTVALAMVGWTSLREIRVVHRDAAQRVDALAEAPAGSIAHVAPYRRHGTPYVVGEDFAQSALRDRVATERFGLRAIAIDPAARDIEPVPPLALRARWDGPTTAAAALPPWYSADPATARAQLAAAAPAAHAAGARTLALVADGLAVPGRADPVVVAWEDGAGAVTGLSLALPYNDDPHGRQRFVVPGGTDAWALPLTSRRAARPLAHDADDDGGGGGWVDAYLPRDHEAGYAIVVCDVSRCALGELDVFE